MVRDAYACAQYVGMVDVGFLGLWLNELKLP